jgi:pimeloyl-ACP methyl ester carboxylesterase
MTQGSQIPYDEFSGLSPLIHFSHANGYLPGAYRQFLEPLRQNHHVLAMRQLPLWLGSDPDDIQDWSPFVMDLQEFYRQHDLKRVITAGHSIGATISLHLALSNPELISKLVLIDPVIFPNWFNRTWTIIYRLGLGNRIHPLARGATRRRFRFASKDAMFSSYRSKPVFHRLLDSCLWDYIDSLAVPAENGGIELAFSPRWEGKIYVTGATPSQSSHLTGNRSLVTSGETGCGS